MSAGYSPFVFHHNPDCGASRNVVEIARAAGHEPVRARATGNVLSNRAACINSKP
jgi:hypothetical protein